MASFSSPLVAFITMIAGSLVATAAAADTLSVVKAGSGFGTVTSNVGAINCGATCSDTYTNGTSITLTATPAGGSQFMGWLGPCTGVGTCQFTISGPTTVLATFASPPIPVPQLDIDGNANTDALTDGLLTIRYLFGLSGASLINGAVGSGASRATSAQIGGYLIDVRPLLDIDDNGQADASTDGLLIIRYLFGLRGASLIAGAVGTGAIRFTAPDIEAQINSLINDVTPPATISIAASNPVTSAAAPTNIQTPTLSGGAGNTEVGAKVYIYTSAICSGPSSGPFTAAGDGSWSGTAPTASANGITAYYAQACDAIGNCRCNSSAFNYYTDNTPPDTLIDTGPAAATSNHSPTFTFHSTESGSSFVCSIDQGVASFAACSGPGAAHTPASPLADGAYTFRVKATDAAGNVDASPATRAFSVITCPTAWTVDAVNGSNANSGKCDAPFKTILTGLSVAASGDTIQVLPGIYDSANGEIFPLALPAGVIVLGNVAGRGASPVTKIVGNVLLGGAGAQLDGMWIAGTVNLNANNVRLTHGTVNNSGSNCINVVSGSAVIDSNTVSQCADAVHVVAGSAVIQNSTIAQGTNGVYVAGGTVNLLSNSITQCGTGVVVHGSASAVLNLNTITGSTSYNVRVDSPATANLGDAGFGSGGNKLSCATLADLYTTSTLVSASGNEWDHVPPTLSLVAASNGVDIYNASGATVNTSSAVQAMPHCN